MSLKVSQNIPEISYKQTNSGKNFYKPNMNNTDSYTPSFGKKEAKRSWFQKLFGSNFEIIQQEAADFIPDSATSEYAKTLAKGLETHLDVEVKPQNLSSIMTPDEFRELLPSLKEENFISSNDNIKNGIYIADLDYNSNHSSGKENIFDILEKVSELANQYYASNRKPFIFALTDRDSVESIQHVIRLVGQNPEKYQHVKILPAVKLSYAHEAPTSQIGFENSDLLVYGINPFDDDLIQLIDNIIANRKKMVLKFIQRVNQLYPEFAYNIMEFAEQNRLRYSRDYTISNLYWRAREYAETKGDIAIKGTQAVPKRILEEAAAILDELDEVYIGSEQDTPRYGSLLDENSDVNQSIRSVFYEFSTHEDKDKGTVVSSAENLFPDIVKCLHKENGTKPVIALCAPFYLSHYFEKSNTADYQNVVKYIQKLQKESDGMLCAFESVVPSYNIDRNLNPKKIEEFNDYIRRNTNLYEVGGSFAQAYS